MSEVLSLSAARCVCGGGASASVMIGSPSSSALLGDLQHLGNLLLVLPAVTEAVRAVVPVRDLLLEPARVALLVLSPRLPLAVVACELGLVDHRDAVGHRADRLAHATAAARLHVGVVEALG